MAVLGRLLVSSAERLDLPDLLSIDSYAAGDWRYFIQGLVGPSKPYILKGFDIIDPQNAIGTQSASIRVADSIVLYPGSNAGPFYHGLSEGNPNALPLVPELRKNAVNYVYLTFSTFNTAIDTRAFWDPDKDGGLGGEFTQDVNTESVLKVEVNVSTGSFPANTVPVAKITVGAVVITAIEDARDLMFRLGTGGINPDPNNSYNFRSLPSSTYKRVEPPTIMTSPSDPNPFQGADKNILSLKEWMDVVMTKLKELGGTTHWYDDSSTFTVTSIFHDALTTTFKSKGKYLHSSADPGELTWTEDLIIKSTSSPTDITIRAGTIDLDNEQVAYLNLVRNQQFNAFNQATSWTFGQNYVNTVGGSIGFFANLKKGDWIKKIGDGSHLFLQVQEFYDTINLGGSVTTPANARSIRLSGNYQGSTGIDAGASQQGIYLASDVIVSDRDAAAISTAGGNFFWLALRSDTILNIASISSVTVTGVLSEANGENAKITATAHGLVDGDRITVAAPAAQAGTYTVEVEDVDTFFINTANTTAGVFTGYYGLATTAARNNGFGVQVETANHGFESGETIIIDGTVNFDGAYVINRRSDVQFQFPLSSAVAPTPPPGSPPLGTSSTYAILGASTVTNTGSSVITGDLGLYPGTSVTGFPPGLVFGTQHITDAAAQQAQVDALAAYTYLQGLAPGTTVSALGGLTLSPGTYTSGSSMSLTGTLTLDAAGDPDAVWVFQIGSTLTTASSSVVNIINGGSAANVYWQVGSSATLGTSSTFKGNIIANASVTATTSATVSGRLFALTAAVTLDTNAVTVTPFSGGAITETTGTATLARIDVRSEEGITKVVQGETIDIGEGDSDNIQKFIGMDSLAEIHPIYFIPGGYDTFANGADYNSDPTDNLTRRVSKLTAMMADKAQDKTVKYLTTATIALNTPNGAAQEITFQPPGSTLTILQPSSFGNATITLPDASPGISLLVNQSAYVVIDRNAASTPSIVVTNTATVPLDENVFVIASRLGSNSVFLWNGIQVIGSAPLIPAGFALIKVNYHDPLSLTLPTGNPVTIDNVNIQAGDLVLFSALTSGANRIYKANGSGTNITSWTAQFSFNGVLDPTDGDTVIVLSGAGFADQMGKFTGTNWVFNDKVRYFNGADYWEQSNLITSTLINNSTDNVFTVNFLGSEYQIIDYSIQRGLTLETGTIHVVTDGTTASVTTSGAYIGVSGVTFSGDISGALLRLRYTLDNSGSNATMKYMIRRWSNSAGGPGGPPSYSGFSGGGSAAGTNGDIQFSSGGVLAANTNFKIDTAELSLNLNGLYQSVLSSGITILDNTASPTLLFSFPAATARFAVLEYSILRNGAYRTGRFLVTNDGTITSNSDDHVQTAITGVILSSDILTGNVRVLYTSTNTGFNGTFKYSMRRWS